MSKKQTQNKGACSIGSALSKFDGFGSDLPTFNLKGETNVQTCSGGVLTLLITLVTLAYAAIKSVHLASKKNPQVTEFTEEGFFESSDVLNLSDVGFLMAFSVEGSVDGEMKDDPRYVKYVVRLIGKKEGVKQEKFIPYHKCTANDWAQFPPAGRASADSWQKIKSDPKRGMFCFDKNEENLLYGQEKSSEYQRIDIMLAPCNYIHNQLGETGDTIHPECIADLDKQ